MSGKLLIMAAVSLLVAIATNARADIYPDATNDLFTTIRHFLGGRDK